MIELTIEGIGVNPDNEQRVVLLREQKTTRYLPIWIEAAESQALAIELEGVKTPRPMSVDLLLALIQNLDASVDSVVISHIEKDTLFSEVILVSGDKEIELDARPSDALALSLKASVPVYADDSVMDLAGVYINRKTGKISRKAPPEGAVEEDDEVTDEELEDMSAFTDFIKSIDMDDFEEGKGNK